MMLSLTEMQPKVQIQLLTVLYPFLPPTESNWKWKFIWRFIIWWPL